MYAIAPARAIKEGIFGVVLSICNNWLCGGKKVGLSRMPISIMKTILLWSSSSCQHISLSMKQEELHSVRARLIVSLLLLKNVPLPIKHRCKRSNGLLEMFDSKL